MQWNSRLNYPRSLACDPGAWPMNSYQVVIEDSARDCGRRYVTYILNKYGIDEARNTHSDFIATLKELSRSAGSLKLYYEEPLAAAMGYHRINFVNGHQYYMMYRIEGNEAIVDFVAHFRRSVRKVIDGK